MEPKISIITATYNRGNYIGQAIESVLVQSFQDWEMIIIDDNSADNTEEIIKFHMQADDRFVYIKNMKRQGVGRARNLGIEKARGKYIAVLDSDDAWHGKDTLQKQYDFLENNPDYVLVGGDAIVIDEKGKEIGKIISFHEDYDIRQTLLIQNRFVHSSVLFRKDIYDKCGKYDEGIMVGEDYDLWLKMGKCGKMKCLSEFVVKYRKHAGNESALKFERSLKCNIEVIDKYQNDYPNYFWASLRRRLRYLALKLMFLAK